MRKLFLFLTMLLTLLFTPLAQASQVTDVKWGVDKQNMLRFVVDLTEPATYQVSTDQRMLVLTVDAALQPQAAGTKKIKSSIGDMMTVVAQGQQTLVKVPLWRDLAPEEYRSFVLKKDPQTKRPPRIVLDIIGTSRPVTTAPVAGSASVPSATVSKNPTNAQEQVQKRPVVTERPAATQVVVSNKPTPVPREPKPSTTAGEQSGTASVKPPVLPTVPQTTAPVVQQKVPQVVAPAKEKEVKEEPKEEKSQKDAKKSSAAKKTKVKADLKGKVITLDPGHGGSDPGALGKNGTMEKTVTLEIALRVKEGLEERGAKVYLTRDKDEDVYGPNASAVDELQARVKVAEKKKSDIFVSIHINSSTNTKLGGFSSYYYPKTQNDARLALAIQKQLTANFGVDDLGIREANFYVIKRCSMPATLLELCFISNPKEEAFLKGKWFPNKASKLIVDGIVDYFK